MDCSPIILAHEDPFRIGDAEFHPATREVRFRGQSSIVEPRIMQMLIALRRAGGGVVTKDELTMQCWGGRVVGEDAINRVVSRLRKLAESHAGQQFRIETITRVGYRIVCLEGQLPEDIAASADGTRTTRRHALVGSCALILGAITAGGIYFGQKSSTDRDIPPDVAALVSLAGRAMAQQNREDHNQAIALYRRVIEMQPTYADGWGLLAIAYAIAAETRASEEGNVMRARALTATRQAFELEQENSYARVADALARPRQGNWLALESRLLSALARRPNDEVLLTILARQLDAVGRFSDALMFIERIRADPFSPLQYFQWMLSLWGAGRADELELVTEEAGRLYPTQFAIWFLRFYIALFGGRPDAAVAMAEDTEKRPSGIPAAEIDEVVVIARTVHSPTPSSVDKIIAQQIANAHEGAGKAENSVQFACLFGRVDEAFAIAEAYFFSRGFVVPDLRFSVAQGSYTPHNSRLTRFLFLPSTKAMRMDPRFTRLTFELGLEQYWRDVRKEPDFRA